MPVLQVLQPAMLGVVSDIIQLSGVTSLLKLLRSKIPSPPLPLEVGPLEVGPLNQLGGLGSAVRGRPHII